MDQSTTEKCTCDKADPSQESDSSVSESPTTKDKKNKISLTSLGLNLRRGRSLQFKSKRNKKTSTATSTPTDNSNANQTASTSTKKSPKWGLKLYCNKNKEAKSVVAKNIADDNSCCKCPCYRRTEEHPSTASAVFDQELEKIETVVEVAEELEQAAGVSAEIETPPIVEEVKNDEEQPDTNTRSIYGSNTGSGVILNAPFFDIQWLRAIHEDCDEAARRQRAREMEQGVEPPANFQRSSIRRVQLLCSDVETEGGHARRLQLVCPSDLTVDSLRALFQNHVTLRSCPLDTVTGCHTQVDFIHCLVPDLLDISNCSFYWGKMDRYEAERLLDGKPEGTFLLRDSAQEEFLFSVSFRKYGRSLHARIEQWNHKFSFDSHDPGVYTSDTVCGLIEHYKDPSSCMFFEPMLTWPLHRNTTFSLQHLCRATITSRLTYDNVNQLQLPKTLKLFLKEYHYRQKVRVERFDDDAQMIQWIDVRNVSP